MGNLPVVHETITSIQCIGDVVTGNLNRPRDRWDQYANESFIGSGIYAAHVARLGDEKRAREIAKGMGRATGKILLGGGILRDVPVLHELATCGESLGDMIGGGDEESARVRWKNYAEKSFFGSAIYAAHEARIGNTKKAEELGKGVAKAAGKAAVTVAAVTATALTGGLAAPLGVAGAVAAGGTVGAVSGAAASASTQAIDHGSDIDAGDVVAGGIIGAVSGAVAGALAAKAAAKAEVSGNTRLAARTFNAEAATQDTVKTTATPAGAAGGVGAVLKPLGPNGVEAIPKPSGPNGMGAVPKPSGPNGVGAVPKPTGPNGLGAVPKPVVPNSPGVVPVVAAAVGVCAGALIATQRNRSLEGNSLLYAILYWWRVFARLNRVLGSEAFFVFCQVLFVALVLTFPGYMLRLVITLLLVGCFWSFSTGD